MVNRIPPAGRPADYVTHQVLAPAATHWRAATCEEVDCGHWHNGWRLRLEGLQPADLAAIVQSGRRYTRTPVAPGETWLVFQAGQPCFRAAAHRLPLERPGIFQVRQGDFRLPIRGVRTFATPEDWRDHMGEHLDRLAEQRQRG